MARLRTTLLLGLRAALATSSEQQVPRRILLVRHGETNFNAAGRIQGTLESQLTDAGHSQARRLGEWLAASQIPIDRVLVSPKARTLATLDEIEAAYASAGIPPLPLRLVRFDLREIELTSWEGQYRTDIQREDTAAWNAWKTAPADFVFPTGHAPLQALWARTITEWACLRENTAAGSTTLVVAHGAFNRAFLAQIFGLPIDTFVDEGPRFAFENCECAEIEWVETESERPSIRWRRLHPHPSGWSTQQDEHPALIEESCASASP